MLDSFKQRNFSDSSRRDAIILFFQSDFLECDVLSSHRVSALVDHSICTLSKLFLAFVPFELRGFDAEFLLGQLDSSLAAVLSHFHFLTELITQ